MATAQQRNSQTQVREQMIEQASEDLRRLMEKPYGVRSQAIKQNLEEREDELEELLPDCMKGQARRLIKRALITFSKNERLQECTPNSLLRCVLEAAELGLPIDGKLCHAVPYNNKVKLPNGKFEWRKEAQCQPDYKGLIVVARRTKQIEDAYADVVRESDDFEHGRDGAKHHMRHTFDHRASLGDRGEVVGAYAVLSFPNGTWRYEYMNLDQINHIRDKSKSYKDNYGPWIDDVDEMRKKTVIRRGLKTYCDDHSVMGALSLDDSDFESDAEPARYTPARRVSRSVLNDEIKTAAANNPGGSPPEDEDHQDHEAATDSPVTEDAAKEGPATDGLSDADQKALAAFVKLAPKMEADTYAFEFDALPEHLKQLAREAVASK